MKKQDGIDVNGVIIEKYAQELAQLKHRLIALEAMYETEVVALKMENEELKEQLDNEVKISE